MMTLGLLMSINALEKHQFYHIVPQSTDVMQPMCGVGTKDPLFVTAGLTVTAIVKFPGNDCTDINQHIWINHVFH